MPKLNPALRERYSGELVDTLERIDNCRAELKEEVRERKGEIAALDKAAFRLRRLLTGRELDQAEIPGAEVPSVAKAKAKTYPLRPAPEGDADVE